jgi:diguanylate cyclase (GGDEF)-like protein/PAS domain S-box-containing protein
LTNYSLLCSKIKAEPIWLPLFLGICLFFLLISNTCATLSDSGKALEKVRLQLKWRHHFQFAGYYAAIYKGYYQDAGLEVELIEGIKGIDFAEEVISGRANFGVELPGLLIERSKGKPVVALAAIFQHSPLMLIMRKDSGIVTPQDLRGRTVAIRLSSDTELLAMFVNEGIPIKEIKISALSWNLEDLIDGRIDAIHAYLTNEPFSLQEKNIPYTIIRPLTYGIDSYGDCLFTSEKEIKEHPKRVKAFRQASLRGWAYAMKYPEEIIDLILSQYDPQFSRASMFYEARIMRKLMLPDLVEIGHMNPGRWQHIRDTFVKLNMLDENFSLNGFLYDPDPEPDYTWIRWFIGLVSLIAACAAVLFVFNLRLQRAVRVRTQELSDKNTELNNEISERKRAGIALWESKERLRISQLFGNIGTWEANLITNKQIWSEAVTKVLGFPNIAQPTWDDFLFTIYPDDRNHVIEILNRHLYEGKEFDVTYRIVDTQGKIRWMRSVGKAEFDANGKPIKLRGTVQDITDRKITEEKLRLSSRIFKETKEGVIITDPTASITDINPAFSDITGYNRDEIIGKNPRILSSGKHSPEFFADMWKTIAEQGHWQGEMWNRKKDGTIYAELLTISSLLDEKGNILHYVGLFSDITQSKKQQQMLELMAHYDVLTQLPNRILLADRFTRAIAHSKRNKTILAVCFLDLDNFKPINDNHGHDMGDQLLIKVAERIKLNIRDEDTVSRQGGDEFALLLGDIESLIHCEQILQRIIFSLAQPYLINNQSLSISASIGVSLYPMDDADLDTLLRHADQAMYQAKLTGRNRYQLFNAEQDQQTILKNIQLQEIQTALSRHEFCLFYQPKVNMQTGKVFGVEALIRWQHPEKGLILPLEFLPIIERTELEIQLGDWVINQALQQLGFWKEQGLELEISINISSYHLQSHTFVARLETALVKHPHLDSKYLQLEILESSALGDLNAVSNIIKTCSDALGINIALDDFGTGYSSLTHLRNLPVHTIKIDQTFVRDMLDDPNDYAIIDGVIGLANSFNREVIAEGVETLEQGLMLLIMGCVKAQGFRIARPMPATNIVNWLNHYRPNHEWIACGNKQRTYKENKIKLFELAANQWLEIFENNINSSPDSIKYWPIMSQQECLCGYWIERAIQEQLFAENWLEKLTKAHATMHYVADEILNQYQQGKIDSARNGLINFRKSFDRICNYCKQSE